LLKLRKEEEEEKKLYIHVFKQWLSTNSASNSEVSRRNFDSYYTIALILMRKMRLQDIDAPYEEGLKRYCKINFNEEQLKILKEFREKVARNFCLEKAEDMLLKSLEWRKNWNIDNLLKWNAPEVLQKYYEIGFPGYAKDGSPVLIIPYGNADTRGVFHSCSKRDFISFNLQFLERTMVMIREKVDRPEGPVTRAIFIFDMDNFSFREFTWKPCLDSVLELVQMYEANYPEILKYMFIINAPKIFSAAFAIVKTFMSENTIRKVKIFGTRGWREVILNEVSPDQLPAHWGGTMTDPDGDPRCPSKIGCGGKIPINNILFDNSYSYLRSKKLHYSIELIDPS
ncbi:Ectonucleoside triphosphate diphosphohydrolase 5, partial [Armadillidium nasatum]